MNSIDSQFTVIVIVRRREPQRNTATRPAPVIFEVAQQLLDIGPAEFVARFLSEGAEVGDAAVDAADFLAGRDAGVVIHFVDDVDQGAELVVGAEDAVAASTAVDAERGGKERGG